VKEQFDIQISNLAYALCFRCYSLAIFWGATKC